MKTDIHPDYQLVIFNDLASGETFLTRSTTSSTRPWSGRTATATR